MFTVYLTMGLIVIGYTQNSEVSTIYKDDGSVDNVSVTYTDGLGRTRESHVGDPTQSPLCANRQIVNVSSYDAFGRSSKNVKPVYSNCEGDTIGISNAISQAQSEYSETNVYSDVVYTDDPTNRVIETAGLGDNFSLGSLHTLKFWYFGRASVAFINNPTEALLNSTVDQLDSRYLLMVSKDENGHFVQEISDLFGNKIAKRWDPNHELTMSNYDGIGNLLVSFPPLSAGVVDPTMAETNLYNTLGQLNESYHPDKGSTNFLYDANGNLRFSKNEKYTQEIGGDLSSKFKVINYDDKGRIISVGLIEARDGVDYFQEAFSYDSDFPEVNHSDKFIPKLKNYYDDISLLNTELNIDASILSQLKNLHGKLVAVVSFDEFGLNTPSHRVVDLFSYDNEGNVTTQFKLIPSMPAYKKEFEYDLNNRLVKTIYPNGKTISNEFDHLGRVSKLILPNGSSVDYSYDKSGLMIFKEAELNGNTFTQENFFNIKNWVTYINYSLNGVSAFDEELKYESPINGSSLPQYNGNISEANYSYGLPTANDFMHQYFYDENNRLIKNTVIGNSDLTEEFDYDAKSRLVMKTIGDISGTYNYDANTNQLQDISDVPMHTSMGKSQTLNGFSNYLYDPIGNVVMDRSKKLVITYDWRNMPIYFDFFDDIPDVFIDWKKTPNFEAEYGATHLKRVRMIYDYEGMRVYKAEVSIN